MQINQQRWLGRAMATECSDDTTPAFCQQLELDGRLVRYAVTGPTTADRGVLVDLGGPGYPLMGTMTFVNLTDQIPTGGAARLIALEEPWATTPVPDDCREAVSSYFEAVHRSTDDRLDETAAAIAGPCQLGTGRYGWTPASYRRAVTAVAEAENIDLRAAVGISFGAQRLRHADLPADAWIAIDSPSDSDPDATSHLATLRRRVLDGLGRMSGLGDEVATDLDSLSEQLAGNPVELDGRSVPVNQVDVGPAAVTASRLADLDPTNRLLSDPASADLVAELADHAWGRMGTYDLSPAYLAYLDEVCLVYTGWVQALDQRADDPIGRFLQDYHRPCLAVTGPATPAGFAHPFEHVCVMTSASDPFSGPEIGRRWADELDADLVVVDGSGHGNNDLTSCLDEAGADVGADR